jgi:hypothetical protein
VVQVVRVAVAAQSLQRAVLETHQAHHQVKAITEDKVSTMVAVAVAALQVQAAMRVRVVV